MLILKSQVIEAQYSAIILLIVTRGPMFFDYNREAEYFGKDKRDYKLNPN